MTSEEPFQVPDPTSIPPPQYDNQISVDELAKYDGIQDTGKIYVAIKGIVFDVSSKREMYGKGRGYNVFAGKDASCALGKSSLKPEDVKADYSELTVDQLKVLDDWMEYFKKRYPIVGTVQNSKQ
ncbi:hypothetical protein MIR68_005713 [Amoeboaphelidium protococcarum]|nr:hypothetical protein MIR68_005713 [Amoeboaphelidium protococcarum]